MKKRVFVNHKTSNVPTSGIRRTPYLLLGDHIDGMYTSELKEERTGRRLHLARLGHLYKIIKMGAVGAAIGAIATFTVGAFFST